MLPQSGKYYDLSCGIQCHLYKHRPAYSIQTQSYEVDQRARGTSSRVSLLYYCY